MEITTHPSEHAPKNDGITIHLNEQAGNNTVIATHQSKQTPNNDGNKYPANQPRRPACQPVYRNQQPTVEP